MDNLLTQDLEALLQKYRAEIQDRIDQSLRAAVASIVEGRPSLARSVIVKKSPAPVVKRKPGRPAKSAALPFAKVAVAAKRPVGRPATKAVKAVPAKAVRPAPLALTQKVDNAQILDLLRANAGGLGLKGIADKLAADKESVFKALKALRAENRVKLEGEKRNAVYMTA